jgi:hypothetical protein
MSLVPPVSRSFMDTSRQYSEGALQARSAMRPNTTIIPPRKTVGGAIGSGAGMAMAGGTLGNMFVPAAEGAAGGGPMGAMIGAGVGLAAYLLS